MLVKCKIECQESREGNIFLYTEFTLIYEKKFWNLKKKTIKEVAIISLILLINLRKLFHRNPMSNALYRAALSWWLLMRQNGKFICTN